MSYMINLFFPLIVAISTILLQIKLLLIVQLNGYKIFPTILWLKKNSYLILLFIFFLLMLACQIFINNAFVLQIVNIILYPILAVLFLLKTYVFSHKVKLVLTKRMFRLIFITFIFDTLIAYLIKKYIFIQIILSPIILFISILFISPFEKLNHYCYIKNAKAVLKNYPSIIKIGITGSYGKTSLKNILTQILSTKYNVCSSPKSYNTPMGICSVINTSVNEKTKILIAEMGARHMGDIRQLCNIVRPDYAIITAIGNQHLASFHSIENIIKTKYEIVENMSPIGMAVFNGDNSYLRKLYNDCEKSKYITGKSKNYDIYYDNVLINENGTTFDIHIDDINATFNTYLLGEHIPSLVVMATIISLDLGISIDDIKQKVATLSPIPHRLELFKNGDNVIIDDAYNSNIMGANNALKTLGLFDKIKVIITPGIVELGKEEKQGNFDFGYNIAKVCDYAIIVGDLAKIINQGIEKANTDIKVYIVRSLEEGMEKLKEIQGGKAILFENDLPDNY